MRHPLTLRFTLAVLMVLGLSGCGDDPPPPPICLPFSDAGGQQAAGLGILVVGQPVRLKVSPTQPNPCAPNPALPSSVTAEVEGPGGEPVTSQIDFSVPGSEALLQFTPVRPGPHHILVAFSQVGGIHQFDFLAAEDRSTESSSQPFPRMCNSLERTAQGAWICDNYVLRGETTVATFSGSKLAVVGDVIWVVGSSSIRRYMDTGTELLQTGTLTHSAGPPEFLVPSADDLVVLHGGSIVRYTFQDGALAAGYPEFWAGSSFEVMTHSPHGILVRAGDWLGLATRSPVFGESAVQVCSYQLLSGRFFRTEKACQELPGEIYGFEPGILWTKDLPQPTPAGLSMGLVRRWVLSAGLLEEQGSLALGTNVLPLGTPLMRPSAVPVVANPSSTINGPFIAGVVTWSPQRKALVLESLDTELQAVFATPTLYWGQAFSSRQGLSSKVRVRPPPSP